MDGGGGRRGEGSEVKVRKCHPASFGGEKTKEQRMEVGVYPLLTSFLFMTRGYAAQDAEL